MKARTAALTPEQVSPPDVASCCSRAAGDEGRRRSSCRVDWTEMAGLRRVLQDLRLLFYALGIFVCYFLFGIFQEKM